MGTGMTFAGSVRRPWALDTNAHRTYPEAVTVDVLAPN